MFLLKILTLAILAICEIQPTKALKCYSCLYAPNVPVLQFFSDDQSCEDNKDISSKFLKECDSTDDICATFSVRFNAILPNVIKRTCAPRNLKKDHKSCYDGTVDQFTSVIPQLSWLRSKVEVCTCDKDNCTVSNSNEPNFNIPGTEIKLITSADQFKQNSSNIVDSSKIVEQTQGLQCYECAYANLPFQPPQITFDKSCDFGHKQNSALLKKCQNRICVTASNYKTSKGIKFVYRTCIDSYSDNDGKCANYTKEELKRFIQHPLISFLDSNVEVCGCKTNGCNGVGDLLQSINSAQVNAHNSGMVPTASSSTPQVIFHNSVMVSTASSTTPQVHFLNSVMVSTESSSTPQVNFHNYGMTQSASIRAPQKALYPIFALLALLSTFSLQTLETTFGLP